MRTHELLNHSFYLPRRFRFQQTIFSYRVRGRRKRLFRFLFFFNSVARRYSAITFKALNKKTQLSMSSFSVEDAQHLLRGSTTLNLALTTPNLPLDRF